MKQRSYWTPFSNFSKRSMMPAGHNSDSLIKTYSLTEQQIFFTIQYNAVSFLELYNIKQVLVTMVHSWVFFSSVNIFDKVFKKLTKQNSLFRQPERSITHVDNIFTYKNNIYISLVFKEIGACCLVCITHKHLN